MTDPVPAPGPDAPLDELLRRGLDWLGRLAPYDVATLFLLEGGELVARAARGPLADERLRRHRLPLARFPSIREALDLRRARALDERDHAGEGDPFDGVLDLPDGHACMVVPLCAGESCVGVLTLDRRECQPYAPEVVSRVEVYGQILAVALQTAREKASLQSLSERDQARARLLETQLAGEGEAVLEGSRSPAVRALAARARQVAETRTPVLILGETGTGKERLARAIHAWSPRADEPFVSINCAAIPHGLLESELFGHVRGAFTGATRDRPGRFQMAQRGTLLLDEVGELPLELQAKLLRVLQEARFEPVGGDRAVEADVRVLAATHVDLERAIAERRFREDLYYRLSVFPLRLPPLRERLEDLPLLAAALLRDQARRTGRSGMRLTPEALQRLRDYDWPGNVRELANLLERATILANGRSIGPELLDVPAAGRAAAAAPRQGRESGPAPGFATLDEAQREHIRRALELAGGRLYGPHGAARLLGLKPTTLQSRMKKLGLRRA